MATVISIIYKKVMDYTLWHRCGFNESSEVEEDRDEDECKQGGEPVVEVGRSCVVGIVSHVCEVIAEESAYHWVVLLWGIRVS